MASAATCALALSDAAGDEGGDDVGGVSVEADTGAVVPHRRSPVGMAGGFLDVAPCDAGIERGGNERAAAWGPTRLFNPA